MPSIQKSLRYQYSNPSSTIPHLPLLIYPLPWKLTLTLPPIARQLNHSQLLPTSIEPQPTASNQHFSPKPAHPSPNIHPMLTHSRACAYCPYKNISFLTHLFPENQKQLKQHFGIQGGRMLWRTSLWPQLINSHFNYFLAFLICVSLVQSGFGRQNCTLMTLLTALKLDMLQ